MYFIENNIYLELDTNTQQQQQTENHTVYDYMR